MAEQSKIEWTDHTFNPWMGCTKVSPACANCYAERDFDHRYGKVKWGPNGTRVLTSDENWGKPLRWNNAASGYHDLFKWIKSGCETGESTATWKAAEEFGTPHVATRLNEMAGMGMIHLNEAGEWLPIVLHRPRVFCASLADVFEDWLGPIVDSKGQQLMHSVKGCGSGDTYVKGCGYDRPEDRPKTMSDIRARLFQLIDDTPHLDWLLLTKRPENIADMWPDDERRENIWLGVTVESQEFVNKRIKHFTQVSHLAANTFLSCEPLVGPIDISRWGDWIDWVITGGESGSDARPANSDWYRSLRDQCEEFKIPFHFKQWGEWWPESQGCGEADSSKPRMRVDVAGRDVTDLSGLWDDTDEFVVRVGKKAAGRLLDGVTHDGVPSAERRAG